MRKSLALGVAACMLFGLTACSPKEPAEPSQSPIPAEYVDPAELPLHEPDIIEIDPEIDGPMYPDGKPDWTPAPETPSLSDVAAYLRSGPMADYYLSVSVAQNNNGVTPTFDGFAEQVLDGAKRGCIGIRGEEDEFEIIVSEYDFDEHGNNFYYTGENRILQECFIPLVETDPVTGKNVAREDLYQVYCCDGDQGIGLLDTIDLRREQLADYLEKVEAAHLEYMEEETPYEKLDYAYIQMKDGSFQTWNVEISETEIIITETNQDARGPFQQVKIVVEVEPSFKIPNSKMLVGDC